MANGHGGPRTPAKPAPVSGPGSLSKRTDGKQPVRLQTGQPYGDREASLAQQQGAPMSATPNVPTPSMSSFGGNGSNSTVIPFNDPSQRPNEPITHGVDIGPGAGSEVLGLGNNAAAPTGAMTALLMQLAPGGMSGALGKLLNAAQSRNA